MATTIDSVVYLCLVAVLWGVTNPLIKKGTQDLKDIKSTSIYEKVIKEFVFFVTNLRCILPFLLNQCGSVLYFLTLGNTDISLAIPLSNSLTFIFTVIMGWFMGEEKVHRNTYIGMIFVLCGTTLCCWDKLNKTVEL